MIRLRMFVISFILVHPVFLWSEEPQNPLSKWIETFTQQGGDANQIGNDGTSIGIRRLATNRPTRGLKGVESPPNVRKVVLQGFGIVDSDLEAIAAWKAVEIVEILDGKPITDAGIVAVSKLPKLRRLLLADTSVTQKGISSLSRHATLTHLTVMNTIIPTSLDQLVLRDLPKLKSIVFACEGISSIELIGLPRLTELADFPMSVTSVRLEKIPGITELNFQHSKLSQLHLEDLSNLKRVDLTGTKLPTAVIQALRRQFSEVEFIEGRKK